MEKDPKVVKEFGAWEKKIRAEWAHFKAQHSQHNLRQSKNTGATEGKTAQNIFKELFAKK